MTSNTVVIGPSATWTFELHEDAEDLNIPVEESRRPGLITRTHVSGYLTENGDGLIINPQKDPDEGYYVRYVPKSKNFALIFRGSNSDKPEIIGYLRIDSWEEEIFADITTPASFRFPSKLLEEYKNWCSHYGVSQTDELIKGMWKFVRGCRAASQILGDGIITLSNGDIWKPFEEEDGS